MMVVKAVMGVVQRNPKCIVEKKGLQSINVMNDLMKIYMEKVTLS